MKSGFGDTVKSKAVDMAGGGSKKDIEDQIIDGVEDRRPDMQEVDTSIIEKQRPPSERDHIDIREIQVLKKQLEDEIYAVRDLRMRTDPKEIKKTIDREIDDYVKKEKHVFKIQPVAGDREREGNLRGVLDKLSRGVVLKHEAKRNAPGGVVLPISQPEWIDKKTRFQGTITFQSGELDNMLRICFRSESFNGEDIDKALKKCVDLYNQGDRARFFEESNRLQEALYERGNNFIYMTNNAIEQRDFCLQFLEEVIGFLDEFFQMNVVYDPKAHPDFRAGFTRLDSQVGDVLGRVGQRVQAEEEVFSEDGD